MTNLEHFVENGLVLLEQGVEPDEWRHRMSSDLNRPEVSVSVDEMWEICQYIYYSYLPAREDEHDKVRWSST